MSNCMSLSKSASFFNILSWTMSFRESLLGFWKVVTTERCPLAMASWSESVSELPSVAC